MNDTFKEIILKLHKTSGFATIKQIVDKFDNLNFYLTGGAIRDYFLEKTYFCTFF